MLRNRFSKSHYTHRPVLFCETMSSRKRTQFSIEEKSCIISKLKNGATNKELAQEYGVPHSTISTIWKEREKVRSLFDSNLLKMKRARTTKHTKIENALLKWYKYQRNNNVPVNGPILQQKANDFARRLDPDFVCSSSWIHRFRVRHNIAGSHASNIGDAEEWLTRNWPVLSEGYEPDNIFSADETGLFYNMTPEKILEFKGEKCSGGKMAKARLTIMVAANMTGSSKKKLLVIGQSKKPSCLENIPVAYENNTKSWMTSEIFEKWLRNWDAELKLQKKKILLLVNNRPAHRHVIKLQSIKLVFLPSNPLQPMNPGVISCLKTHYRTLQVLKLIQNLESNNEHECLSVFDAVLLISEAWDKVTQKDIADCFKNAGFKGADIPLSHLKMLSEDRNSDEDDISLAQLAWNLEPDISLTEVEEFINIDNSVTVCAPATDDEIVAEIIEQTNEKDEAEEHAKEQFEVPSLNEGLNAISVLRKIVICNNKLQGGNCEETLVKIQCELQNAYAHLKCNKKILK